MAKKTTKPKSKLKRPKPKTPKPIELYFWPTPNGWKISIALEELKLPYVLKLVNIGKGEQFEPSFLKIAPNNRMPAIVDPDGPGGKPISVFESGAILQYLGRKTGKFYPQDERARVAVEEWLFWQVGGLGPMAGQNHHFSRYAPEKIPYAIERYVKETNRLYGVLNRRLADREFVAGAYSIADMAAYPWVVPHEAQGQRLEDFPHPGPFFGRQQINVTHDLGFGFMVNYLGHWDMRGDYPQLLNLFRGDADAHGTCVATTPGYKSQSFDGDQPFPEVVAVMGATAAFPLPIHVWCQHDDAPAELFGDFAGGRAGNAMVPPVPCQDQHGYAWSSRE